jgi:plastocyanin
MKPHVLAAVAAVSVLLGGCGTSTTAGTAPSASSTAAASQASGGIVISGFAYSGSLTVKPGQKVTVTNQDSATHTLTDKKTHLFDTGDIAGDGGKGSFTAPTKPGSYPFGCTHHLDMEGTLIVAG